MQENAYDEGMALLCQDKATEETGYCLLFEKYRKIIYAIARRMLSARGLKWDDDAGQEASIALLNAAKAFRPEAQIPFKAFMLMCVKRKLQNYIEKQIYEWHYGSRVAFEEAETYCLSVGSEEWKTDEMEQINGLAGSILTKAEKKMFFLLCEGRAPSEISNMTGKPAVSVYSGLYRIRSKFKKAVKMMAVCDA